MANLSVESNGLDVSDGGGGDPVHVVVPNGNYCIEAKIIDFAGSSRISRLRAFLDGVSSSLGEICDKVPVDSGAVIVADFQGIENGLTTVEFEEWSELLRTFANVFCDICQLRFESRTIRFIKCNSGLGDGHYPVYALNAGDQIVGLEVEFLKDGHNLGGSC